MKKVLWIVVIVLVALIGWRIIQTVSDKKAEAGPGGKPRDRFTVPVETAPVRLAAMQDVGRFGGSLKSNATYTVAPQLSGRLERLLVHLGDRVSNGQVIAEMDASLYQQELEQNRAALAVAQAQVEQLRLAMKAEEGAWQTVKRLFEQNYESQGAMDKADADYAATRAKHEIALAEVRKAQAALTKAEIQYSYTKIKASWSGGGKTRLVGEIFADEGDILTANTPILTLVDNSSVTAEIDVIEKDYVRIRADQAVDITTDAYPDKIFPGRLARLAPVLQESSRQARAEIEIPNPDGLLKPGMFVRVSIIYSEHKDVPVVPLAALVERDGQQGVFLADKEKLTARFVPLKTGIRDAQNAEVVEPELSGEIVILGQEQLQDGGSISLAQNNNNPGKPDKRGARP